MGFKRGDGSPFDVALYASTTDNLLIEQDGVVKEIPAGTLFNDLGGGGGGGTITTSEVCALIDSKGFISETSADSKYQPIGDYLTSANASAIIAAIASNAGYITSADAQIILEQLVSAGDYISSADASAIVTQIMAAANYVTESSVIGIVDSAVS